MTPKTASVFSFAFVGLHHPIRTETNLYALVDGGGTTSGRRLYLLEGEVLEAAPFDDPEYIEVLVNRAQEVPDDVLERHARSVAIDYARRLVEALRSEDNSPHPFTRILETHDPYQFGRVSEPSVPEYQALEALRAAFDYSPLQAWRYAVGRCADASTLRLDETGGLAPVPRYLLRERASENLESLIRRDLAVVTLPPIQEPTE